MPMFQVRLFGKFSVSCDNQILDGLESRKAQELFGFLLVRRERPQSREFLAELLCGDCDDPHGRKSLRQALWQIQSAFGARSLQSQPAILDIGPDWVQIHPAADFWLDVAAFEAAFLSLDRVPGDSLSSNGAAALRQAADLYTGDLLEGWYQDWCLFERERLQNIYLSMLDKLMGYCLLQGDYEAGLAYGDRILRQDRARERTHQWMMRLHYLAGDRTGAIRQYDRCVAALRDELDLAPSRRTEALYEQIRADRLESEPQRVRNAPHAPLSPSPVHGLGPDRGGEPAGSQAVDADFVQNTHPGHGQPLVLALHRLRRLQTFLALAQEEMRMDIEILENRVYNQPRTADA
jgi:DNA-binding SARP family transcriptional activator